MLDILQLGNEAALSDLVQLQNAHCEKLSVQLNQNNQFQYSRGACTTVLSAFL